MNKRCDNKLPENATYGAIALDLLVDELHASGVSVAGVMLFSAIAGEKVNLKRFNLKPRSSISVYSAADALVTSGNDIISLVLRWRARSSCHSQPSCYLRIR